MDPITIGILIFLALCGGGAAIAWTGYKTGLFIHGKNKVHLAVFGLPQTGKTLFFNCLKSTWHMQTEQTTVQGVDAFKLKLNDTWFKINDTTDVGGGDNYFREYAESLIKESNFIMYFCNIHDYLSKEDIAKKDRARLQRIKNLMTKYNLGDDCVRIVLSYADQVKDRDAAQEVFVHSIASESYAAFGQNIASVNMTDENETKKFISALFYGRNK